MTDTNMQLPEMTVEQRVGQSHGLPAPDLSAENIAKQKAQVLTLNDDAKQSFWPQSTIDILKEYIPIDIEDDEISNAIKEVFGFKSWKETSRFVVDDMCSEFFNIALKYCLKNKQTEVNDMGFIDGSGIGYLTAYKDRLHVTINQCFDEKYFHKTRRPRKWFLDEGVDLAGVANAMHPGHWSYPAGHGTKFLTVIEVLRTVFTMSEECDRNLFIAACVGGMARSGSLIHWPMDNLVGGKLTTLVEFN